MAFDFRKNIGIGLGQVGNFFNLPEFGLSEKVAGTKKQTGTLPGTRGAAYNYFAKAQNRPLAADTVPEWQQLGYQSEAQYLADQVNNAPQVAGAQTDATTGISTYGSPASLPTTQSVSQPSANPISQLIAAPQAAQNEYAPQPNQPGYQPQIVYFNGQPFDVNDPSQRQQFFNARNGAIDTQYQSDLGTYGDQLKQTLGEANKQYQNQYAGIQGDIANLGQARQNYGNYYNKTVGDTNQNYDVGTVNRGAFFASAAPNAYQSSQGTSQQYAQDQHLKALGDLQKGLEQTNAQYDLQGNQLNSQLADLGSTYNDYVSSTQSGANAYQKQLQDYYSGQRDQLSGDFTNADLSQGIKGFNYNRANVTPTGGQQVDLSQYTPYLNFNQLAGAPGTQQLAQSFIPKGTSQTPYDQYLGYTPDQKSKNYLSDYLKRGY